MNIQQKQSEAQQAKVFEYWRKTAKEHRTYRESHPDRKPTAQEWADLMAYQDYVRSFG